MRAIYAHAWMQKHPTPTRSGGDFHWHPDDVPEAIRATFSELAARDRGHVKSAWIIDRSYAAWARAFTAVSPDDQRKYTGLSVTIARIQEPPGADHDSARATRFAASLPALFAHMPMHPAAPFAGEPDRQTRSFFLDPSDERPQRVDPDDIVRLVDDTAGGLARGLLGGGQIYSREPHAEALPALMGRLLSWLPETRRATPRTGMFSQARMAAAAASDRGGVDNLVHYLAACWSCAAAITDIQPDYPRDVWRLVCQLAGRAGLALEELFAELTDVADAWQDTDALLAYMARTGVLTRDQVARCDARAPGPLRSPWVRDAGWLWNRIVHYWGRGFLPDDIAPGLAGLLARRIAVDHLFHLDAPDERSLPRRYLRRLRYEALLSRERNATMNAQVAHFLPTLPRAFEVTFGG